MQSGIGKVVCCGVVAVLALVGIVAALTTALSEGKPGSRDRQTPPVAVTISRETTAITEPLRDGYPDYVAALNLRFGREVTPENNAAVLFWQAVGPGEINDDYRANYFQMLGIPPLPEKGDYFVDFDKYLAQQNETEPRTGPATKPLAWHEVRTQVNRLNARPWSRQEFPQFAGWLAANEKPLALVVEASKRPRRYDPLVGTEKTRLIAVLLPAPMQYKTVADTLAARATLRLHEGKVAEAWEDLLTCHRLARLLGQGPMEIDVCCAGAPSELACAGNQVLLQHAQLTAAQIREMREDLNRLPPLPTMADILDVGERFAYLDTVVNSCCRGWPASMAGLDRVGEAEGLQNLEELEEVRGLSSTTKSLVHHSATTPIDWDLILRMSNSWFDKIVAAYRKPTRAERRESLHKIDEDLQRLKETVNDLASLDREMQRRPRQALSTRLGEVLLVMFSPPVEALDELETRTAMRFELDKLAFALAAYRADLGSYPAKLADLVPKYVAEVPEDWFNEADLQYRREGDGFLLYSVGINGKDDGARSYNDRPGSGDDLVVRLPASRVENEKP